MPIETTPMRSKFMPLIVLSVAGIALGALYHYTSSNCLVCSADNGAITQPKGNSKMSTAAAISTDTFEQEVLKSAEPVLVDFWAPWCMPCKMLGPTIDELAGDYAGKIKVVKVNVDENQPLAGQYGVRGIPTIILFKKGEPADRLVGAQPKQVFVEKLDKALAE